MQDISNYIKQLTEDIQQAKAKYGLPVNHAYALAEDESGYDELIPSTHITKPLSEIVGIRKEQLPPSKELNDQHSKVLVEAILSLLASHRIYTDFPNLLPTKKRYKLIRDYWDNEITLKGKEHHIDFCHYSLDDCPYQGYCTICDELNDE